MQVKSAKDVAEQYPALHAAGMRQREPGACRGGEGRGAEVPGEGAEPGGMVRDSRVAGAV